MRFNKKAIAFLSCSLLLSACGSSGSSSGGGDDSAADEPFCSGEQMAGEWRLVGNASGFTISDTVTLTEDDVALTSTYNDTTDDGVTLEGTINNDCNVISGTFTGDGISGDFTMVKQ